MKLCPICMKVINKGQKIAVLSFPLTSLDHQASYDFVSEFIDHELIVHLGCFKSNAQKIVSLMPGDDFEEIIIEKSSKSSPAGTIDNSNGTIGDQLLESLKSMGEKVSRSQVQTFLIKNQVTDLKEAISVWLRQRESMV